MSIRMAQRFVDAIWGWALYCRSNAAKEGGSFQGVLAGRHIENFDVVGHEVPGRAVWPTGLRRTSGLDQVKRASATAFPGPLAFVPEPGFRATKTCVR